MKTICLRVTVQNIFYLFFQTLVSWFVDTHCGVHNHPQEKAKPTKMASTEQPPAPHMESLRPNATNCIAIDRMTSDRTVVSDRPTRDRAMSDRAPSDRSSDRTTNDRSTSHNRSRGRASGRRQPRSKHACLSASSLQEPQQRPARILQTDQQAEVSGWMVAYHARSPRHILYSYLHAVTLVAVYHIHVNHKLIFTAFWKLCLKRIYLAVELELSTPSAKILKAQRCLASSFLVYLLHCLFSTLLSTYTWCPLCSTIINCSSRVQNMIWWW